MKYRLKSWEELEKELGAEISRYNKNYDQWGKEIILKNGDGFDNKPRTAYIEYTDSNGYLGMCRKFLIKRISCKESIE